MANPSRLRKVGSQLCEMTCFQLQNITLFAKGYQHLDNDIKRYQTDCCSENTNQYINKILSMGSRCAPIKRILGLEISLVHVSLTEIIIVSHKGRMLLHPFPVVDFLQFSISSSIHWFRFQLVSSIINYAAKTSY